VQARALIWVLLAVPVLAFADCGGGDDAAATGSGDDAGAHGHDDGSPDGAAGDGSGSDDAAKEDGGPNILTSCDPGGPDRAVVLAVMGSSPAIQVMTQRGGSLVDRGHTFPLAFIPERLAMRPDGQEALVAYGGFGNPFGVVTVSFSHDGATASIGTPVELTGDFTPWGLDYVTNDRAILALAGASAHMVVTLDRKGASFAETTRVPAPGTWPLKVVRRPGTPQALLARSDLSSDKATDFFLLDRADGGGYVKQGTSGSVRPPSIDFAVAPTGTLAYSPSSQPENPITSQNIDAGGFLSVLSVSDAGLAPDGLPRLPRLAMLVAADPLGRFLVLAGDVYEITQGGTPEVSHYVWLTMPLDATGAPLPLFPESAPFPAVLPDDIQLSPSGHLVDALDLATLGAPEDKQHPVEIRAQPSPGQWTVCQKVDEPGATHVAIAP
jgi:hypothetical protein